jgi:hypothetical protein
MGSHQPPQQGQVDREYCTECRVLEQSQLSGTSAISTFQIALPKTISTLL